MALVYNGKWVTLINRCILMLITIGPSYDSDKPWEICLMQVVCSTYLLHMEVNFSRIAYFEVFIAQ